MGTISSSTKNSNNKIDIRTTEDARRKDILSQATDLLESHVPVSRRAIENALKRQREGKVLPNLERQLNERKKKEDQEKKRKRSKREEGGKRNGKRKGKRKRKRKKKRKREGQR